MWVHKPVLPQEVIEYIGLVKGGVFADFTFGEGGHSELMLDSPVGIEALYAVDRDISAVEKYRAEGRLKADPRLHLTHSRFSEFAASAGSLKFDGILMDLGVSTRQLTDPQRGFTFQTAAPLDMRMDPSDPISLEALLSQISVEDLGNAIYANTDSPRSRWFAQRIMSAFQKGELKNTEDLARIMGPRDRDKKAHPATVPFMGLRMLVNQELEEIQETIPQVLNLLKPGGRLVVITFHSSEDRVVKHQFQLLAGRCICKSPLCRCPRIERVKILTKKPVEASPAELSENPRSRSAKLRCIENLLPQS